MKYHDEEWGVPVHDDKKHFEFLVLESAQAGLSWLTILRKRENYRKAYDDFDVIKVSNYDDIKYNDLLQNPGIVRNRLKITASINNAKHFRKIQEEFGSFDTDRVSSDLKSRGFKFLGTTIVYAHLQATGIVNDHITGCFRYNEVKGV